MVNIYYDQNIGFNKNIRKVIDEFKQIVDEICKQDTYLAISGINLSELDEKHDWKNFTENLMRTRDDTYIMSFTEGMYYRSHHKCVMTPYLEVGGINGDFSVSIRRITELPEDVVEILHERLEGVAKKYFSNH